MSATEPRGYVDVVSNRHVAGWAWHEGAPAQALTVVIWSGPRRVAELPASLFRADLRDAGIGDGCHAFDFSFAEPLPDAALPLVRVSVKGTAYRLPSTATAVRGGDAAPDCQVNVYTFAALRDQPPSRYGTIRFDPNNTCNLRCVYCHNHRSAETIGADDFSRFLHDRVLGADHFQVGCIMEPTMDPRLADLMLAVAASPARPGGTFMLQTNGILLHRHDAAKLRDAGLTQLYVSMDTAEAETLRSLRNGTSLQKVLRNSEAFVAACPEIETTFIATVTAENVAGMQRLVELGLGIGIRNFVMREVFYHPDNDVVDHARMPGLLLPPGRFEAMRREVTALYAGQANFTFADGPALEKSSRRMIAEAGGALDPRPQGA